MSADHPRLRVLLVDDDPLVRDVLEEMVALLGYATVSVTNGVAGLAVVKREPPDAVLLDVAMPGVLDGVQTLQAIKAHAPALPVIMVTANVDLAIGQRTLRGGAFEYLMKPVDVNRLREVLAAAVLLSGKAPPP
jgi:CheY-like chemotaxis protein